ncbi:hypothetical protein CsatB_026575 [Cannabis sativa]
MTVIEYTTQLKRLARLALRIVPIDFSKKEKYLDGLNPKIKHDLMITTDDNTTYADMVGKAQRAKGACGLFGHYKRDYPQLKKEEQKTAAKPAPTRIFALTQADAEASPSVVIDNGDLPTKGEEPFVFVGSVLGSPIPVISQEIDFVIDLAPGAVLVSKAPYRMALVELNELKIQLKGWLT